MRYCPREGSGRGTARTRRFYSPATTTRSSRGFELSPRVPLVEDRDAEPAAAIAVAEQRKRNCKSVGCIQVFELV